MSRFLDLLRLLQDRLNLDRSEINEIERSLDNLSPNDRRFIEEQSRELHIIDEEIKENELSDG